MTHKRIQYTLDGDTWQDCERIEVRILPLRVRQKYDDTDRYPTSARFHDQWDELSWVFVAEGINVHLQCEFTSELNILGIYSEWESYCDVYDAMIS